MHSFRRGRARVLRNLFKTHLMVTFQRIGKFRGKQMEWEAHIMAVYSFKLQFLVKNGTDCIIRLVY